eukprot:5454624-Amphidinium_carterae.2
MLMTSLPALAVADDSEAEADGQSPVKKGKREKHVLRRDGDVNLHLAPGATAAGPRCKSHQPLKKLQAFHRASFGTRHCWRGTEIPNAWESPTQVLQGRSRQRMKGSS